MTVDATSPRSRRSLLRAATAAVAAGAAGVLTRSQPTQAADPVLLGVADQNATSMTEIVNGVNGNYVFRAMSVEVGGQPNSGKGPGIAGFSSTGNGVYGHSNGAVGVYGDVARSEGFGVYGQNFQGVAVHGETHDGTGVKGTAGAGTGVYGVSSSGSAVYGETTTGIGVFAISSTGDQNHPAVLAVGNFAGVLGQAGSRGVWGQGNDIGVIGESETTGVRGHTASSFGVGLHGVSDDPRGLALKADGRVGFSRSGLKAFGVGAKTATVAVGGGLKSSSKVLCTLESDAAGLAIGRITKDTGAGSFNVFLNRTVPEGKAAKVAWFVIG